MFMSILKRRSRMLMSANPFVCNCPGPQNAKPSVQRICCACANPFCWACPLLLRMPFCVKLLKALKNF